MSSTALCPDCGEEQVSAGSLDLHRLRAHIAPPPPSPPASAPSAVDNTWEGAVGCPPLPPSPPGRARKAGGGRVARGVAGAAAFLVVSVVAGGLFGGDPEGRETARKAVLDTADLPAGWVRTINETGDRIDPALGNREYYECAGLGAKALDRPNATRTFERDGAFFAVSAVVAKSADQAHQEFLVQTADSAAGCLGDQMAAAFRDSLPAGVTMTAPTTRRLPDFPVAGDESAAYSIELALQGSQPVAVRFAALFIRRQQIVETVFLMTPDADPVPPATELVALVDNHLRTAFPG